MRLLDLNDVDRIPLYVDGADEATDARHLIKGGGGALTREKIVAAASARFVILVGPEKRVATLGARGRLPVEVLPFGESLCAERLRALGCEPVRRETAEGPFITDNGNLILDCKIGPLEDPTATDRAIRAARFARAARTEGGSQASRATTWPEDARET